MREVAERLIGLPPHTGSLLPSLVLTDDEGANPLFLSQLDDVVTGFVKQVLDAAIS